MEIEQVKKDIELWIANFLEVPHPALGGFSPCPYARAARVKNSYTVYLGTDPYYDLKHCGRQGMGNREVVIYVYDPTEWAHEQLAGSIELANREVLVPRDMLALGDHPNDAEIVNGVCMNQGTYALALVQSLSDLDAKAKVMAERGFYNTWPEEYLTALFQHRKDPRA